MSANICYIIRFYKEADDKAYFLDAFGTLNQNIANAKIFETSEDAQKHITEHKGHIKKHYKRGYLYIAKAFYEKRKKKSVWGNWQNINDIKLTKPDRHDFLDSI